MANTGFATKSDRKREAVSKMREGRPSWTRSRTVTTANRAWDLRQEKRERENTHPHPSQKVEELSEFPKEGQGLCCPPSGARPNHSFPTNPGWEVVLRLTPACIPVDFPPGAVAHLPHRSYGIGWD